VRDVLYADHDESCWAGAINPVSLAPFERLCRICGTPNAVIFRLQDKTEVVERVNAILTLNIDLKVSRASNGIQDPNVRKMFFQLIVVAVFRIHRIHIFLGLPDPSIIKQK
jgi:hypothetical protein